jgi:hypothetical protein
MLFLLINVNSWMFYRTIVTTISRKALLKVNRDDDVVASSWPCPGDRAAAAPAHSDALQILYLFC